VTDQEVFEMLQSLNDAKARYKQATQVRFSAPLKLREVKTKKCGYHSLGRAVPRWGAPSSPPPPLSPLQCPFSWSAPLPRSRCRGKRQILDSQSGSR